MKPTFGLIGYPLHHSFSPAYFTKKFEDAQWEASYDVFPLEDLEHVELFLKTTSLSGFNVTIPYKERIIPYLNELDEVALEVGAVNTVVRTSNGWKGYNTDVIGFEKSIVEFCSLKRKQALIFGNGGAANAVKFVLAKHHVPYTSVTRHTLADTITYAELTEEHFLQHSLVINTTPVGMFPDVENILPIPIQYITGQHHVYDLIYNPACTKLMELAEARGARVKNGLQMLHDQADAAYELFRYSAGY
jgi:shikimate dehydrogenase